MEILIFLIPLALIIACIGIYGVFWSITNEQFDDIDGAANRILTNDHDDY